MDIQLILNPRCTGQQGDGACALSALEALKAVNWVTMSQPNAGSSHRRREVRARPIDVYKRLPIARMAVSAVVDNEQVYEFLEDDATKSVRGLVLISMVK